MKTYEQPKHADAASPRRNSYGRSRGKALRKHHASLVVSGLPGLEIDLSKPLRPDNLFRPGVGEVWLEVGFGGGEHLLRQASAHPDVGFIGCEPFINGVAKLLAGIEAASLTNVKIRSADAQTLLAAMPAESLSRAFVLYPDPWPKRRQHKRRIVSTQFLAELSRVLRPGAVVRLATDIDDYAGWIISRFLESGDFLWGAKGAEDWRRPWNDWQATRYEIKAKRGGRAPVYLTFERVGPSGSASRGAP